MAKTLFNFKRITTNILLLSVALEIVFFFDPINILASMVLLYGWLMVKEIVLTKYNMLNYPVSFLMIFGLVMFHYVLPIPLTLLEFKPVTYNLVVPLLTFWHHFLFITIIVFSYSLYLKISNKKNIFRNFLSYTNFYKIPSDRIIWMTALLGLGGSFYTYFVYGQWQRENTDRGLLYYLAGLFIPFLWMPIIIPFKKFRYLNDEITETTKTTKTNILLYSGLVFIIALTSNMRTILFSGVMTLIFLFVIGILFGYYDLKKLITPKKALLIGLIFFISSGPLIDLGITMVVVRGERTQLSAADFLTKTVEVYQDKERLNKIKSMGGVAMDMEKGQSFFIKKWNEDYLSNLLLNRFSNLKISDNCLYHAKNIGYGNLKMQEIFYKKVIASMPNVMMQFFGMSNSEKIELELFSITDYLYSLSINDTTVRGSAILGSIPGVGMAIFGYWYLGIIIPVFFIIFYMFDSFVKVKNGKVIYSYFFFIMLLTVVNYFNDRHVYTFESRFILRTYIETIVVFLITMKLVRILESIFFKSKK